MRADGNVLLPVDTVGRALELILILEQVNLFWKLYQKNVLKILFWVMVQLEESQNLLLAVLGTTTFDLSYLLSDKCGHKHNWLCQEFPWMDEWLYCEVLWAYTWQCFYVEVSFSCISFVVPCIQNNCPHTALASHVLLISIFTPIDCLNRNAYKHVIQRWY